LEVPLWLLAVKSSGIVSKQEMAVQSLATPFRQLLSVQLVHLLDTKVLNSTPSTLARLKKKRRLMLLTGDEMARWPNTIHRTKKL
jgi:hypothetical protein